MSALEKMVLWIVLVLVAYVAFEAGKGNTQDINLKPAKVSARQSACVKAVPALEVVGFQYIRCADLSPRVYPKQWYYAGRDV